MYSRQMFQEFFNLCNPLTCCNERGLDGVIRSEKLALSHSVEKKQRETGRTSINI